MATNTEKIVVQVVVQGDKQLGNLEKKTKKTTMSFGKLAAGIGSAVVAFRTAVKVISAAIRTFKDFEFEMAKVKAITGANEAQFKKLTFSARELGKTTFFTATQVAKLQVNYGKLGFTTQEILDAQAATIDLATATQSDLARAATVAGASVRGFGLDASETKRVVDVMAVAFTSSAMDIEKFQTSMTKVAPIAKAAGFSLEDTTAIMSKLTDAGIEASIAGTSLRNILLKMQDPNSDLTKSFGKTIHSFDELLPAMNKFVEEGGSMADIMEVVDLRQAAAFEQMLSSSDATLKLRDALNEATGAAEKMSDVIKDTLEGDLKELTSAWEGFQEGVIAGSPKIVKSLRNITDVTTELLNKLSDYFKSNENLAQDLANDKMRIATMHYKDNLQVLKSLNEEEKKLHSKEKSKFIQERIDEIDDEIKENQRLRKDKMLLNQNYEDENKQINILIKTNKILKELKDEQISQETKEVELKEIKKNLTDEERITLGSLKDKIKELKTERDLLDVTNIKAINRTNQDIEKTQKLIDKLEGKKKSIKGVAKAQEELDKKFISNVSEEYWNNLVEDVLSGKSTVEQAEQDLADFQIELINNLLLDESLSTAQRAELDNQLTQLKLQNYKKTTQASKDSAQEQKDIELANLEILQTAAGAIFDIMGQNADRKLEQERKSLEERKEAGVISQEEYEQEVEKVQRKAFKQKKKRDSMEVIMNTAMAVAKVFAQTGIFGFAAVAPIIAVGAAQLALIQNQKYALGGMIEEFANGGMVQGKSHANGGEKFAVGGRVVELEGGEAVINKRSTAMFRNQLSAMNSAGGGVKFADGGLLNMPSFSQQQFNALGQNQMMGAMGGASKVVVVEADITSTQNSVSVIESDAII